MGFEIKHRVFHPGGYELLELENEFGVQHKIQAHVNPLTPIEMDVQKVIANINVAMDSVVKGAADRGFTVADCKCGRKHFTHSEHPQTQCLKCQGLA